MNNFIENYFNKLKENNFLYPEIELKALLKYSIKKQKEIFLYNLNHENIDFKKFQSAFNRRLKKEPISKIIKSKEFWSEEFYVNSSVLDPRPESELIIETAQKLFVNKRKTLKIADLGTGSGCLAIILAKIFTNSKLIATEIDTKAIRVAKINISKHQLTNRIKILNCHWIDKSSKFDLIISNPPYLSDIDYSKTDDEVKLYEPQIALRGGKDGLKSFREIASNINNLLDKESYFVTEIGYGQLEDVRRIFNEKDMYIYKIIKDLQSIDRVLVLKKKNEK